MLNINRIRLKLTLLNSGVVLSILICIAVFIIVTVSINNNTTIDNELITSAYTLKRYISVVDTQGSAATPELSDEYLLYKEKLLGSYIAYGIYGSGDICYAKASSYQLPDDALTAIRLLPFCTDDKASRVVTENDGVYYIHSYRCDDLNLRICTTVTAGEEGSIRIVQTIYNLNIQESVTDRLSRALFLAVLLGVSLSLVSGYFIAGRSIKPIQQSMQRQNEFIADASHELRTPVTIMRTNLDVLRSDPQATVESQSEWLESAYRETGHMEKLITALLETAKADLGRLVLEKVPVDLNEVCEINISRFKSTAAKKKIELIYLPDSEKVAVSGDRARLIQLLSIITDNAVRYTPAGRSITLSMVREGSHARITLRDEGIGIEKEECEKIFERFYRTDKARSRAEGGSGLGLAIAREITAAHGGSIYAESEKGRGTVITIILPIME